MTSLVRAFAWLRWRLFVNGLRGRRRDSFEQVSRISRLLVGAIVAVSLIPGSVLLAVVAFLGGRGLAAGSEHATVVGVGARAVIAVVTIVIALHPLMRFGGAASSMTRLALLPVPRAALFAGELAGQLADPWLLALTPALAALPAGLLVGGAPGSAGWAALAGLLVLAVLASLGSASSLVASLLFRNRRAGELATVGFLVGITLIAYLPMLASRGELFRRPKDVGPERRREEIRHAFPLDASAHRWIAAAPWELYARTVEISAPPRRGAPAGWAAGLALTAIALGAAARWSFGRLLDAPADRRAAAKRGVDRVRAIPGLSPAASAVARAMFRLLTRSVRGRVVLYTLPLPALLFAFMWRDRTMGALDPAYTGVLVVGVTGALALLSMTTLMSGQFAADRAGLTLTFLTPASGRDIVAGKAVGAFAAFAIPLAIGTAAAAALHPRGSPWAWAGAVATAIAAWVAASPLTAALAAWFPAPFDLSRLKAGNAHPFASIVSSLGAMLAYAACGGAFAATLALTHRPVAGFGAALLIAAAAAGVARVGWPLAARAVDARRENLAMVAQGR